MENKAAVTPKTYRIHGFLKTTAPMHIAAPGSTRFKTGDIDIACTPIQKLSLPSVREIKAKEGEGTYLLQNDAPVITGNTLNGGLRRMAARLVQDALVAKGDSVTAETYSAMNCGAVTGKPDSDLVLFDEYRRARQHVFVGLFGGGPRMMARNARVFNSCPVTKDTEFMLAGPARHPNYEGVLNLRQEVMVKEGVRVTQQWAFVRRDDLTELADIPLMSSVIEDFEKRILERQELILADKKAKDAKEEGSRYSTRTFSALEFVIPGIDFPLTCELDVTPAQLGLYLEALDRYAAIERLGGVDRNGFGQFVLNNVVLVAMEDGITQEKLFIDGRLNRGVGSPAIPFLEAWDTAKQELQGAELNHLYRPPVVKEKDLEKAEKKAAKKSNKGK